MIISRKIFQRLAPETLGRLGLRASRSRDLPIYLHAKEVLACKQNSKIVYNLRSISLDVSASLARIFRLQKFAHQSAVAGIFPVHDEEVEIEILNRLLLLLLMFE